MYTVGFEPTIPAIQRLQTYALRLHAHRDLIEHNLSQNATVAQHKHCPFGVDTSSVPREGGVQTPPPPEIPKALQNRAKLNPIVKTVKNC